MQSEREYYSCHTKIIVPVQYNSICNRTDTYTRKKFHLGYGNLFEKKYEKLRNHIMKQKKIVTLLILEKYAGRIQLPF